MRAAQALETATYVGLVGTMALFATLGLLALSDVREVETRVSATCGSANVTRHVPEAQGVRQVKFALADSPLPAPAATTATLQPSRDLGDALGVWGRAPDLVGAALQMDPILGSGQEAATAMGFSRLRDDALLIGGAALVSGLMLLALICRSFFAEKAETREVTRAMALVERTAKEGTAELQRAISTLKLHSMRVDAALEEERVRIARDIHDDLGSILTALKIELCGTSGGTAEPGRTPRTRRASTDLVDAAMQSVRRLITALQPYPLERAGLWGALEWKAAEVQKLLGIPCRVFRGEDLPQPSKAVATATYRIVEEALTNVARHAGATAVDIVVNFVSGRLMIEVTDNGRGMSKGGAPAGSVSHGLTGMRERAQSVGGSVTVASRPGIGTTVRFSVQVEVGSELSHPPMQEAS